MTAPATARRLQATPRETLREARLRLVAPGPVTAPKLPFVVVVVAILATGLLSLLMLNTLAAQDSFRLHDLQRRSSGLADTEQQLRLSLDRQSSPSSLAALARGLGMRPADSPAFLRLRDGRIVGVATAAPAPPPPAPVVTPAKATKPAKAAATSKPGAHPTASALPPRRGAGHSGRAAAPRPRPSATTSPAR